MLPQKTVSMGAFLFLRASYFSESTCYQLIPVDDRRSDGNWKYLVGTELSFTLAST